MKKLKVLVVEDEVLIRKFVVRSLEKLGCEVAGEASTGEQAIDLAEKSGADLVLMDVKLSGKIDGIQAAMVIGAKGNIKIAFMSAYDHLETLKGREIPNCIGFLEKPVETYNLREMLEGFSRHAGP